MAPQDLLPGSPQSQRALAIAALLSAIGTARADSSSAGNAAQQQAAAIVLRAAAERLPQDESARLRALLTPLPLAGDPRELAERLREWLEEGGAFFESRLRALVEGGLAEARPREDRLARDLRVLLGRLALSPRPSSSVSVDAPDRDGTSAASGRDVSPDALGHAIASVASGVLSGQLHVAYEWLAHSTLAFEVPVGGRPGGGQEERVQVRFRREPGEAAAAGGQRPCTLSLHVESAAFGAVDATIRWQDTACRAAFFVDRAETASALEAHADSLRSALAPVFKALHVEVVLDAARARQRHGTTDDGHLPSGSIVSVRT